MEVDTIEEIALKARESVSGSWGRVCKAASAVSATQTKPPDCWQAKCLTQMPGLMTVEGISVQMPSALYLQPW